MGSPSSLMTMHGIHRYSRGWLNAPGAVQTLPACSGSCSHSVTLTDLQANPSLNGLSENSLVKFERRLKGGNYFLSYRQGTGLDANLAATYKNKVSLHYWDSKNTLFVTSLSAGQSYTEQVDYYGTTSEAPLMTITVNSISSGKATVTVDLFEFVRPYCVDVTVNLYDSWGDGWNGNNLYFTANKVLPTTLSTGSSGIRTVCLPPGTYSPFVCGGTYDEEISWSIPQYGLSGGADNLCSPTSLWLDSSRLLPTPRLRLLLNRLRPRLISQLLRRPWCPQRSPASPPL